MDTSNVNAGAGPGMSMTRIAALIHRSDHLSSTTASPICARGNAYFEFHPAMRHGNREMSIYTPTAPRTRYARAARSR